MDANKLQTQARYITQNRKLTTDELEQIVAKARVQLEKEQNERLNKNNHTQLEQTPSVGVQPDNICERIRQDYQIVMKKPIGERKILPKIKTTETVKALIQRANDCIACILKEEAEMNIYKLNCITYAAATVIIKEVGVKIQERTNRAKPNKNSPPWQKRLENKILKLRKDLSSLAAIKKGILTNNQKKVEHLFNKYNIKNNQDLEEEIEKQKQMIAATAQRLRRYRKRSNQYHQNKLFETNPKQFYHQLKGNKIEIDKPPTKEQLEEFWGGIMENEEEHDKNATWLKPMRKNIRKHMTWTQVTLSEIQKTVRKTINWKSPGIDCIQNFWWKQLTQTHSYLAIHFNKMITKSEHIPEWLARGRTVLIPKTANTEDPKNYRPITCLNTMYKILTGVLSEKITEYLDENHLIPKEQKGCCRNSYGCKDQLMFSRAILEDCTKHKRKLYLGWIDYKKAYDSVPKSWLEESMRLLGVAEEIVSFNTSLMETWETSLHLPTNKNPITTRPLKVKRGIYQGDALSPILFCIAMAPLSLILNKLKAGYKIKDSETNINHLLYMDDLKYMCTSLTQLRLITTTIQQFSTDIKMEFGLDKCAVAYFNKGELERIENIELEGTQSIKSLEPGNYYKYLGIKEGKGFKNEDIKQEIRREYLRRTRKILESELSSKNKISAIGALATPVIEYSFAIVQWTNEEIRTLDRKTRKLMTIHGMLHPKADVDRLYVTRKNGGRGLRQLEAAHTVAIYRTAHYIEHKAAQDHIINTVKTHEDNKPTQNSITKKGIRIREKFFNERDNLAAESTPATISNKIKKEIENNWKRKPLHGQLQQQMNEVGIDKNLSFLWLRTGNIRAETESLIIAAQDQALTTRAIEARIHRTQTDGKCRICQKFEETVEHITAGCPILAEREYIERHNRVCHALHFTLSRHFKCPTPAQKWYEHTPPRVITSEDGKTTILFDQPVITDRTVTANRPDIIVRTGNECLIIDVAIPSDRNIVKKEAEKVLKYKSLLIEVQRMWNVKANIIPIVIGATGFVTTNMKKHLEKIPGKHSYGEIQKTVVLGTAHILRRALT